MKTTSNKSAATPSASKRDKFGIDWSHARGSAFWKRPHWTRRLFFQHAMSALGGYFLMPAMKLEAARTSGSSIGTAKNVIFILMSGGPSHVDTFDFKTMPATPREFAPEQFGDIVWPRGIMPKLADQMDSIALMRSVKPWAAVHQLSQTWIQIGRNPTAGLSRIAPHIGSVVSVELTKKDAVLPAFLSLNTGNGPGAGYLASEHAPFYVNPGGGGLGNTRHGDGEAAFNRRFALLRDLAGQDSLDTDIGPLGSEIASYNLSARRLMYNADVDRVFTFDANERARFGNTGFGNACIAARNLLKSDLGTRFVQITIGGWDNHANIYGNGGAFFPGNTNSLIRQFDNGLGTLIGDLRDNGLLDSTLVIAMGEFGRTVRGANGSLNAQGGRDHFLQQGVLFAGAKVAGRKAIGTTDAEGYEIVEPGWSGARGIRAEDIEATIYSALGIDWTKVRRDDPFGRGFEYVPIDDRYEYRPVDGLWS